MEAVIVEDLKLNYVELSRGKYLINNQPLTITNFSEKVSVENFDNIKKVTENKVLSYYLLNEKKVSVEDYIDQKLKLEYKRIVNEDGDSWWDSLEDEFEYKKFIAVHQPIYRVTETVSEPLTFSPEKRIIDTGNPLIVSEFSQGINNDLFVYKREAAYLDIFHKTMKDLGMEYKEKIDYNQTAHKKVYGNSTHSGIRYATAFGSYIFNDSFEVKGVRRGTLESMKALYEDDKKLIEDVIKTKYNTHFGIVDKGNFDFQSLLKEVESALSTVKSITYTKKGYTTYLSALKKLNEIKVRIEQSFEVKEDATK